MPVPVAINRASLAGFRMVKKPSGGVISTESPGFIANKCGEKDPSCTKLRHSSKRFPSGREAIEDRRDLDVYICGLKAMVDDVRGILKALGFDRKQIIFEKYD